MEFGGDLRILSPASMRADARMRLHPGILGETASMPKGLSTQAPFAAPCAAIGPLSHRPRPTLPQAGAVCSPLRGDRQCSYSGLVGTFGSCSAKHPGIAAIPYCLRGLPAKCCSVQWLNFCVRNGNRYSLNIAKHPALLQGASFGVRRRLIFPGRCQPSIVSVQRLNFCVRNGNRWIPLAITTGHFNSVLPKFLTFH